MTRTAPIALVCITVACGSSASAPSAASSADAGDAPVDAAAPLDADKAAPCATTFGSALTNSFGRLDGTVLAVVPPNDQACAKPNSTHLVIQVVMGGAAYRMVVDVLSTQGSPDVWLDEIDAPLAGGAWSEGWHPGVALDYAATLGVHSSAFTDMNQADLVAKITSEIDLGAKISVFATSSGASYEPDSAHLVHRNAINADGAIVVRPDSGNPHWLLLRFAEQSF